MSYSLRNRHVILRPSAHLRQLRRQSSRQIPQNQDTDDISEYMSTLGVNDQNPSPPPTAEVETNVNSVNSMQRYDYGTPAAAPPVTTSSTVSRKVGKIVCKEFTGSQSTLNVNEWLDVFQALTLDYTDAERLYALPKHLSDEVIEWFALEIVARIQTMSWDECRRKMIARFGRVVANRMVEASQRALQRNETVNSYYNEMRRLMTLSNATEEIQIAFLTRGMPESYRLHLASQSHKTCEEWLRIALAIEEAKHSRTQTNRSNNALFFSNDRNDDSKAKHRNRFDDKKRFNDRIDYSKPPRTPCPRCLDYGIRAMHWRRDCTRSDIRKPDSKAVAILPTQPPTVNASMVNDFLYYDVTVNGYRFRPFLDTGSTICVMSLDAARRAHLRPDSRFALTIRQIDGTAKTLGRVDAKLQIGRQSRMTSFQVIDTFAYEMLLGVDVARDFGLKIDFSRQQAVHTVIDPEPQPTAEDPESKPENSNISQQLPKLHRPRQHPHLI